MDDDTCCVEHAPERRRLEALELRTCEGGDVARVASGGDRIPGLIERGARGFHGQHARRRRERLVGEQPIDRRKVSQVHRFQSRGTLMRVGRPRATMRAVTATVLIVDDHAGFRTFVRALLEEEGFDVVGEATDGAGALALARALAPEDVLLDVALPDMDGFAVCDALLAGGQRPAVVDSSRDISSRSAGGCKKARLAGSSPRTSSPAPHSPRSLVDRPCNAARRASFPPPSRSPSPQWIDYQPGDDLALIVADGEVGVVLVGCGVVAWERRGESRRSADVLAGFTWLAGTLWAAAPTSTADRSSTCTSPTRRDD